MGLQLLPVRNSVKHWIMFPHCTGAQISNRHFCRSYSRSIHRNVSLIKKVACSATRQTSASAPTQIARASLSAVRFAEGISLLAACYSAIHVLLLATSASRANIHQSKQQLVKKGQDVPGTFHMLASAQHWAEVTPVVIQDGSHWLVLHFSALSCALITRLFNGILHTVVRAVS